MTKEQFSYLCGYGSEHWPLLYWGAGVESGLKWLALIQEDYTFTFKTDEQRFLPENFHLAYGP